MVPKRHQQALLAVLAASALALPATAGLVSIGLTLDCFNMKRYRRFLSGYGAVSEDEKETILALNS